MPLNLSVNDGDFTPYLKYNTKAGRWYIKPEGASEEVEIDKPRLAFDMSNIKTGWIFFQEGAGPEKVWDTSNTQEAPRPPGLKKFKRGFEVAVYGNDPIPGVGKIGLREFSSTAANCITSILGMYADYEREAPQHPGEVPFFACLGVKPISGAYGTNYEPQFVLKGWVPRIKIPEFDQVPSVSVANGGSRTQADDFDAIRERNGFAPNARDRARAASAAEPAPTAPPPADDYFADEVPF